MARRDCFAVLAIVIVGVVVYANSLRNEFVYDDFPFVVHNPAIRQLNHFTQFFTDHTSLSTGKAMSKKLYRPVLALSFAVDYAMFKLNPTYYHLENVLLHILNAMLVYFLMRMIAIDLIGAVFISLLFLTNPVQTEVVNWISHKADTLGLLFYLSALIAHIKTRSSADKEPVLYFLTISLFTVSLLCKESMITLPVLLFIVDAFIFHDEPKANRKKYFWYYFPFFIVITGYLILRLAVLGQVFKHGSSEAGPSPALLMMFSASARYILLLIFPVNLSLAHTVPEVKSMADPNFIFGFGLLSGIFMAAFFLRKYSKLFTFGVCWFFISFMPVLVSSAYGNIFERHLYIPSIGFFIAIIGLVTRQQDWLKKTLYCFLCVVLVIYGALTISRNKDWKDDFTLFRATVRAAPQDHRASYSLARTYYRRGMEKEAIEELERTIKIDRLHSHLPYAALGDIYYKKRDFKKSIEYYSQAIRLTPNKGKGFYYIGRSYYQMNDMPKAIENFREAIELDKNSALIHYDLARAYGKNGQTEDAINELGITMKLKPNYPGAAELLQKLCGESKDK